MTMQMPPDGTHPQSGQKSCPFTQQR